MTSTKIVERVARLIAKEEYGDRIEDVWENYVDLAREIITALRNPTEEMRRAMKLSIQPESSWGHPDAIAEFEFVEAGYVTMIDAAVVG